MNLGLGIALMLVLTWWGAMYTLVRALRMELADRDRQETNFALAALVAVPAVLTIAPIRDVTAAAVRSAVASLARELWLSARWLFGLGRQDAINAFEAVFRGGVFVLIIVAAFCLGVFFLWLALWLIRLAFQALNLVFQWFNIDWVLPEVQPARLNLSEERSATARQRGGGLWDRVLPGDTADTQPAASGPGEWRTENVEFDLSSGMPRRHARAQAGPEPGGETVSPGVPRNITFAELVEAFTEQELDPSKAELLVPDFPDLPRYRSPQDFHLSAAPVDLRPAMRPLTSPGRWLPIETPEGRGLREPEQAAEEQSA